MISYKPISEIDKILENAKTTATSPDAKAIISALEAVVLMLAREGNNS